jgi:uncharacterized protein DUF6714
MNVRDYSDRLYAGFAAAPKPERTEITPHRCGECDEVTARLFPHAARDVPDEDMLWLGDSLPLLSAKAYRFYLPRFIEFCLNTPHSSAEAVINYNLAPSGDLDTGDRNRFVGFSEGERRLVLEFVEHRAGLEEHGYDQPYLERARAFWRNAA